MARSTGQVNSILTKLRREAEIERERRAEAARARRLESALRALVRTEEWASELAKGGPRPPFSELREAVRLLRWLSGQPAGRDLAELAPALKWAEGLSAAMAAAREKRAARAAKFRGK